MAYQTGTVTTPSALKSVIEAFAVANGWTNSSGVLHHASGSGFYQMTANDTADALGHIGIDVAAALAANMTTTLCPQDLRYIYTDETEWNTNVPATYHLFAFNDGGSNPQIFGSVNYNVLKWQHFSFGESVKYLTYTGGAYFYGGCGIESRSAFSANGHYLNALWSGYSSGSTGYYDRGSAPFWGCHQRSLWDSSWVKRRAAFLHAEIDGYQWPGANEKDGLYFEMGPTYNPMHTRMPANWSGHTQLLPWLLTMLRADGRYTTLGHIPNLFHTRNDYLDPGEIITIGSTKYKVMPWYVKDTAVRDGGTNNNSGTWACAITYDGP